jgi:dienelactone hydrolase
MITSSFCSLMRGCAVALVAALPLFAIEAVTVVDLPMTVAGHTYTGRLALPGTPGEHPAVLVVPEWWGLNAYAEQRARELAELGYVALAADVYGEPASNDFPTAVARSQPFYAQPSLFAVRLTPALATLSARPEVDSKRLAAVGFCFGGSAVLQLARGGADLKLVVVFHAGLATSAPAAKNAVHAKIVVCHGGADPFVPPAEVAAFSQEMLTANAAWEFHSFPGAVHAFTNPQAGRDVINVPATVPFAQAAHYDANAEAASMVIMRRCLAEAFAP